MLGIQNGNKISDELYQIKSNTSIQKIIKSICKIVGPINNYTFLKKLVYQTS